MSRRIRSQLQDRGFELYEQYRCTGYEDRHRAYGDKVTPEASFLDDLGGDSLDIVELVMALEDEFGITIPDADIEQIATAGDAIRYVEDAKKFVGMMVFRECDATCWLPATVRPVAGSRLPL